MDCKEFYKLLTEEQIEYLEEIRMQEHVISVSNSKKMKRASTINA